MNTKHDANEPQRVSRRQFVDGLVVFTFRELLGKDPFAFLCKPQQADDDTDTTLLETLCARVNSMSHEELQEAKLELLTFWMFTVCQAAKMSGISDEILDDYVEAACWRLTDKSLPDLSAAMEMGLQHIRSRFSEYCDALGNEAGAGPMFHFGVAAARNVFQTDEVHHELWGSLVMAGLLTEVEVTLARELFGKWEVAD